jgi:deaminated glutathione amidase
MTTIVPYKALALQIKCNAIHSLNVDDAKNAMLRSMQIINKQIQSSKAFIGQDLQLVVLPEYFLTGFPTTETIGEWQEKGCILKGDEVYQAIQQTAIDNAIYLSGNVYEKDAHFPNLYFQASFIVNPQGEIILNYRRLNSMYAPTPHDVLDEYIAHYGIESLFPVAKTAIGNLACIASEEILYPEIARCFAMNGAEVFLHSTSEVASNLLSQKNIAKMARAIENMAYVISANTAGIHGTHFPEQSADGSSQIVQYEGIKLAEAAPGNSMVANATIHIDNLRSHRKRPGMSNFLARQRNELFVQQYQKEMYKANSIDKTIDRSHFINNQKMTIQSLIQKGIITE